jgi:hypothetical protein
MNPYGDPMIRVGVPFGDAEYEVRSWAVIEKASGDEKTLVRHVKYTTTPLKEGRGTAQGKLRIEQRGRDLEPAGTRPASRANPDFP